MEARNIADSDGRETAVRSPWQVSQGRDTVENLADS